MFEIFKSTKQPTRMIRRELKLSFQGIVPFTVQDKRKLAPEMLDAMQINEARLAQILQFP